MRWLRFWPCGLAVGSTRTFEGRRWTPSAQPAFEELYDLQSDPDEMRNLAREPAHAETQRQLTAELERLRRVLGT